MTSAYRTHIIPANWDVKYVLDKANLVNSYNISTDSTNTTISYTSSEEDFNIISSVINNYPVTYAAEVLKPTMLGQVLIQRNQKRDGGVSTPFGVIDSDLEARVNILGTIELGRSDPVNFLVPPWRFQDNSIVALTYTELVSVGQLVGQHVALCQARKNELDSLINSASTVEDLELIDITTGWPV